MDDAWSNQLIIGALAASQKGQLLNRGEVVRHMTRRVGGVTHDPPCCRLIPLDCHFSCCKWALFWVSIVWMITVKGVCDRTGLLGANLGLDSTDYFLGKQICTIELMLQGSKIFCDNSHTWLFQMLITLMF